MISNLARCSEVGAKGVESGLPWIVMSGLVADAVLELGTVIMIYSRSGDAGESVVAL